MTNEQMLDPLEFLAEFAGFTPSLRPDRLESPLPELSASVPEQNGVRGSRAAIGRPALLDPVDFPLAPAMLTPMPGKGTSYRSVS